MPSRLIAGLALLLVACAKDVVLPDEIVEVAPAVCGNGVVEAGEKCDVASPGCVECQVVPTWTCQGNACSQRCGDGVVGQGGSCGSPRREAECDMSGYWAVRETDFTRDSIIGAVQSSSNWFLYRLEQTGDDFRIAESLDCGVHVTGSATVDYTPASLRVIIHRSRMDAQAPGGRGPRKGTSRKSGSGCAVDLNRWYKIVGAVDSLLPTDFLAKPPPPLSSLPPLPKVNDPVVGQESPAGADDPDGDQIPGVAFSVLGIAKGIRNSAQRTWKQYATLPDAPVPASSLTLEIPGGFDLQESVLRVTECGGACALVAAPARAAENLTPRMTLFFIGKTLGSPRVADVVAGAPRQDLNADLSTCAKVRLLLPHVAK